MRMKIYASSQEIIEEIKDTLALAANNIAKIKPANVIKEIITSSPSSAMNAFQQAVASSLTQKSPSAPQITVTNDPFGMPIFPRLEMDGTVYEGSIIINGLPKNITVYDLKDALNQSSLVLHASDKGYEIMDLNMAETKYGKAFALEQSCIMTGESFQDLCEKYPFIQPKIPANQFCGPLLQNGSRGPC